MGQLLKIFPKLNWPLGIPFQVEDEHNGHQRGTWYYRTNWLGQMRGPFHTIEQAAFHLELEKADA